MNGSVRNIVGGKWWKVDFHVHTPASEDYGKGSINPEAEKTITPKEFLKKAIEKEIDCLVISDHNTFTWIDRLRNAMKELLQENDEISPIVIFPAVEVNAEGNNHLLAIFSPDIESVKLERIFGQFKFNEDLQTTTESLCNIIKIIIDHKGIAIPAHVDRPSGLFYNESASTIKGVLAIDGLIAFEVMGEELNNQLLTESKRRISYVMGSDSHCLDTLGSKFTWVKMGKPSIEALRLALYDNYEGVLRSEYTDGNPNDLKNRTYIKYIDINQAKYAGRRNPLRVEFSPWMTSIIGGRGTGKSSIVQFLRMILNKQNELPESLMIEYDEFAKIAVNRNDLGMLTSETEIKMGIVKDGIDYYFVWKDETLYEEIKGVREPVISFSDRFPIRIFNQKQLYEMTKDPQLLLRFIDEKWDSMDWENSVKTIHSQYYDCALKLVECNSKIKEKRKLEAKLREVDNKISIFETEEIRKVLDSKKEYLIAEQQAKEIYRNYEAIIVKSKELYINILSLADTESNTDKIDDKSKIEIDKWLEMIKTFMTHFKTNYESNIECFDEIDEWFSKLNIRLEQEENKKEIEKLLVELKEKGVDDIDSYSILLKQKDELLKEIEVYLRIENEKEKLDQERTRILYDFYNLIKYRIEKRNEVINNWNKSGNLRISIIPMGNIKNNEESFRSIINKPGITFSADILAQDKNDNYVDGIIYQLANPENVDCIVNLEKIISELVNHDSTRFSKKFRTYLNNAIENSFNIENELFMWIPEDLVKLELKRNNRFISIDAGSAGQRTSAILTLLLQVSKEPIVIDQPEDDLDTKNISDFIVKGINEKKNEQQIIVVTHNPNIVVNTNSEQVIHMEFAGGEINASHSGALQDVEIRDAICDVMEGGRDALESRYYRISKALE